MRRVGIVLPALLVCALAVACGGQGGSAAAPGAPATTAGTTSAGTTTTAPAQAPRSAKPIDLTTVNPCGLAGSAGFATALGTQTKPPKVARSADSDITCVVESAVDTSAITLDVLRPDEGAQAYLEENRNPDAKPVPGLG